MQVKHLFRLDFLQNKGNVIFIGTVGIGKTHLATALAHTACLAGHAVLYATAVNIINSDEMNGNAYYLILRIVSIAQL